MEKVLITGSAGFIGMHTCLSLLKKKKIKILGLDNLNTYYDLKLKIKRRTTSFCFCYFYFAVKN
jgi:UDP-glucuronate 4-epimerase